jgi:hypothetical protein
VIVESSAAVATGFNRERGFAQPHGTFTGGADDVIHPDLTIRTIEMERQFRIRDGYLPRGTIQPPTLIHLRCGCLHSRPTLGTFEITEDEIAAALNIPIA